MVRLRSLLVATLLVGCCLGGGAALAGSKPPRRDPAPPQQPRELRVESTGRDAIVLAWRASHDNRDGWDVGYGVYRNGALVGSTRQLSYRFGGLACGTSYRLEVDAFDAAGNRSRRSAVSAATAACPPVSTADLAVAPDGSDFAWSFVAATYDGAALRVFVDGRQVAERSVGGGVLPSDGPLRIGGNAIWGEWFAGLLDNVRVYDRPLAPAELEADRATPVRAGPVSGLVAAYAFDERSGSRAFDATGHGHDALLEGGGWTAAGVFGGALSLDGIDDRATVPHADALDLSAGMTLDAWVRPSALGADWRTVLFKEDAGHVAYSLYANTDAHAPGGQVWVGGEQTASGTAALAGNPCRVDPCAGFDHAYRAARPGERVEVRPGSYRAQTILFDASKTSRDHVVFRAVPGTASVAAIAFGPDRFTGGASHLTLEGLTVDGDVSIPGCGVPDGTACPPDSSSPGNDLTFRNLRVKGPYAFYCASCSNVSLLGGTWGPDTYACRPGFGSAHPEIQSAYGQVKRANHILIDGVRWQNFARCTTADHTECLQVEPADQLTIRNSIFRNCDTMAVNLANDLAGSSSAAGFRAPNDILIENNFFDTAKDATGGPTYYALNIRECTNCLVRSNSWVQAPRLPDGEVALNVAFVGNAGPITVTGCAVAGVTFSHNVWEGPACAPSDRSVADAGFVDRASLDLHLRADSPAVDAGDPASFPATDIDGDRRPAGPAPDAGADERMNP